LSANQPAVLFYRTKSAPATGYQQISSTVLSSQNSTSHQPQPSEHNGYHPDAAAHGSPTIMTRLQYSGRARKL